ncbi:hypothetical protein [Pseudoblastomonas halimionae]|uniref:Uncharacterized protein n=1 Tax=Alteriqipengyuania halimionae TaxID=1926630 RepID=A0A6I4U1W7_9SPHN|nr:hypothetical protein [Alteriqipengyuania halimionae]MXP08913.1 hypothetical protein [Alteriqipengyuania halimionae]
MDKETMIIVIVGVMTLGWLINNWIRAKHGYPLEDEWGGKTEPAATGETKALREENRALHEKLDGMQDRMIVLEKIVTDRGYGVAEEIERLRDQRKIDANTAEGAGVPLDMRRKERG